MNDAGGGGGGGGTDWYGVDPRTMMAWLDRDLSAHYEQANSWKKASELTGLYQSRLQTFRDRLAQAWNPSTSPAAETYLTKLDELIKAVKDVDDVTGRNYQAAVDIPNAIYEAKTKLQPIVDRYRAARADYDAEDPADRSTETNSPSNRSHDEWVAAAAVMYKLSGDLSQSQYSMSKPAPYVPPQTTTKPGQDDGGDIGSGTVSPPVIPPVVPVAPPSVPSPVGPTGPVSPVPGPRAPDLQGLNPTLPGPTLPGTPPSPTLPTHPTGPTVPGPLPPGGLIPKPPPGGPPKPGPAGIPPKGGMPPSGLGNIPPGPTTNNTGPGGLRPTGVPSVIGGGTTGGGTTGGGARPTGAGTRPNPVGGMIGGATPGRSGTPGVGGVGGGVMGRGPAGGAAGAMGGRGPGGRGTGAGTGGGGAAGRGATAGAMGVAGGRAGGRRDEDGEHYDPDTAWDVAQGVAPVLDAPEAQRPIDPGPAIGLSR